MSGPPTPAADMAAAEAKANVFRLRLALQALLVHFKSHGYIRDRTMDLIDFRVVKQVLSATARQGELRDAIGKDRQIWKDLQETFEAAVPSFERRAVPGPDPAQPEFDQASGPLIAANATTLIRDIDRMNDLVGIGRNVLASGEVAQNNAGKTRFDQAIFKIISICVKVTARGYDGDAGPDEEKWQTVVNDFKRLLINCLQFLNNSVTQNERRKLVLWVHLFDSTVAESYEMGSNSHLSKLNSLAATDDRQKEYLSALASVKPTDASANPPTERLRKLEELERKLIAMTSTAQQQPPARPSQSSRGLLHRTIEDAMKEGKKIAESDTSGNLPTGPFLVYIGKNALSFCQAVSQQDLDVDAAKLAKECERRWKDLSVRDKSKWCGLYERIVANSSRLSDQASKDGAIPSLDDQIKRLRIDTEMQADADNDTSISKATPPARRLESVEDRASQMPFDRTMPLEVSNYLANGTSETQSPPLATEADYRMAFSAEYGADILQRGKDDLMKRLEPFVDRSQVAGTANADQTSLGSRDAKHLPAARNGLPILPRSADYFSEADSEEEDYGIPGDDGRGLLTDVPLILGPNEIEVLPMIILSGIVPPPSPSTPGYGSSPQDVLAIRNMHTIRCHFLLAQDNGRNLLRELLIFVAAWDLREDELYFKFMVKIMEAILNNGLMPFSYHAFRESKDIISPAQAVIMKLLTNIFRLRQARFQQQGNRPAKNGDSPIQYPTRVDVHMVNFLLTEFRRHIIPQTCALIFLQGQIRAGHASPEDFPLNLWDMERMYEGIYQYLEFFAILTENDSWKSMMTEWRITSELVTLLKELDGAIPRSILAREMSKIPSALKQPPPVLSALQPTEPAKAPPPVSVERPYDVTSPGGPGMPESTLSFHQPTTPAMPNGAGQASEEEPSDFPWKNLKKLTVLVLSSLTWKSQRVQDQVRTYGGIDVVLSCTKHDDFNPYIREHAIMALRFLVEGNEANRAVVRALELKATEMARAKGAAAAATNASTGRGRAPNTRPARSAEEEAARRQPPAPIGGLFELMKEVMRDMPARVKGQSLENQSSDLMQHLEKDLD